MEKEQLQTLLTLLVLKKRMLPRKRSAMSEKKNLETSKENYFKYYQLLTGLVFYLG